MAATGGANSLNKRVDRPQTRIGAGPSGILKYAGLPGIETDGIEHNEETLGQFVGTVKQVAPPLIEGGGIGLVVVA
jgi:hypothetical protein